MDPNYALAWSGLANYNFVTGGVYGYIRPKTAYAQCRKAIEKAMELDDTLPEAHALMASLQAMNYDWQEAERISIARWILNPGQGT